MIEGAADEPAFFDAVREVDALGIATVEYIAGVEHPLAEWPGIEPAPQIPAAKTYDARAAAWFARRSGADRRGRRSLPRP